MSGFLERILASRRAAVDAAKRAPSRAPVGLGPPRDFAGALRAPGVAVIAEFKRASPSRGPIDAAADAAAHARAYAAGGASAVSVLTEPEFFRGCGADLAEARGASGLPALWKDFVIDPWQVGEARSWGADAVLVIVRILDDPVLAEVVHRTRALDMTPVLEVFDEDDLERALLHDPDVVGINNRDLDSFVEDPGRVARLAPCVHGAVVAGFSAIATRADVEALEAAGVQAVLVGEALMRAADPAAKVRELLGR